MIKSSLRVSATEYALVETIRRLGFGEIYGIEILDDTLTKEVCLTAQERALINTIWNGLRKIDILIVHNGAPIAAEVDFEMNGFRCRKKYRFSTE